MKRVLLLVLVCIGVFNTYAQVSQTFSDQTKEIVATLGVPFTIAPYSDLGIPYNAVFRCYASDDNETEGSYELSDETNVPFSIMPNMATYKEGSGSATTYYNYYSYTLTPVRTGFYTFKQKVKYRYKGWGGFISIEKATITYQITVVDLTSISIPTKLTLNIGENYSFTPILTHPNAQTTLSWLSSNNSVATIDENGLLTTTGIGTTTITCIAHNGVSAQCEVTVNSVLVSSIALSETEAEMTVGGKLQLEATVLPENAMDKSITWSSSNEDVAWVSGGGKVIAVGPGFCQIKATANDGSGKAASCFVEVTEGGNIRGDVNGDGRVTIEDVVKLIDLILEKE